MKLKFNNILVLAPHTDDAEFGCGGSIARFINAGSKVTCVAFSAAEESIPDGFDQDTTRNECKLAANVLGINVNDLHILDYRVRHFPSYRQDILEYLVHLNKSIAPDLVLMPSITDDLHQDHMTVAQEGLRAFKKTNILSYEVPWNNREFKTSCFIAISSANLKTKQKAISCYKSQQGRSYANPKYVEALAITRGGQIGVKFAEVFDIVRWVI